ncbi:hypothetical protein CCAX7_000680 [Capsulimonas corticalis]|uniref:Uncharacterized protein n=1 Tax=Capsulimonas corticalis TaxID=2219043 RepID=A0A402CRJ3_9BACT|nr:hypothetical protein [Capsulimonas corticalis]BDI28017.1 hypothetical protein CCAX7_000680 [Capsulimonas corticalis]
MMIPGFVERWVARLLRHGERWSKRKITAWVIAAVLSAIISHHVPEPTVADRLMTAEIFRAE